VLALLLLVAGCTLNGRGPDPVTRPPPADPQRMPSAVLDHQDPGADTSKHPVLTRTEAHYSDPLDSTNGCMRWLGLGLFRCAAGGDGDSGGLLVIAAVLAATRRRKRRRRNRS